MTSRKMFMWENKIVDGAHFFNFLIQLFRSAAEHMDELPASKEKD